MTENLTLNKQEAPPSPELDPLVALVSDTENHDSNNSNNHKSQYSRLSSTPGAHSIAVHSVGSRLSDIAPCQEEETNELDIQKVAVHESQNSPVASYSAQISESKHKRQFFKHWKTLSAIVGHLVFALCLALGHFWLFKALDSNVVDEHAFKQSQISVASILLVTLFKATVIASTAICFAQRLWFLLCGPTTPISIIEQLFTMRTNLMSLSSLGAIRRAPSLFFMAAFVWCVGIAMIYPPGALTIALEPYNHVEMRNLSVMNPPVPLDFNPFMADELYQYRRLVNTYPLQTIPAPDTVTQFFYPVGIPLRPLRVIANSVIRDNPVLQLPISTSENSSYELTFRAPQFRCTTTKRNITAMLFEVDYIKRTLSQQTDFNAVSIPYNFVLRGEFPMVNGDANLPGVDTSVQFHFKQFYNILFFTHEPKFMQKQIISDFADIKDYHIYDGVGGKFGLYELTCVPYSVKYRLGVSYPKGLQRLNYTQEEWKILPNPDEYRPVIDFPSNGQDEWPWPETLRNTTSYPEEAKAFIRNASIWFPIQNEYVILSSLIDGLNITGLSPSVGGVSNCGSEITLDDGTPAFECGRLTVLSTENDMHDISGQLRDTVFDISRFNESALEEIGYGSSGSYLTITEELLNQALTNITISALSLGTWWDLVPVNFTQYRSTYKFSQPLYLILPYSICLGLATSFALIAFYSLWRNGIEATDGGFIQIMMATRGETEMEKLAIQDKCVSSDISDELKKLKIRYGELIIRQGGEDRETRPGFGTVEETKSLRKRR